MSTEPLIDAHHHLWDLQVRSQPWLEDPAMAVINRSFLPADHRSAAARMGVTSSVLVETVNVAAETPEMLAIAGAEPLVCGVVGWVDLTADDVQAALSALRAAPGGDRLVGVRHQVQGEPDPRWLCRPDVRRGLAAVARSGLVFDLLVTPVQLPAAIDTVAALPELSFVLAHAGKPDIAGRHHASWAEQIHALAGFSHVTTKLSGLVTEAGPGWAPADLDPYVATLLETFGPDRLMWGSDWPVCLLAADVETLASLLERWTAGLTVEERHCIRAGTVTRVYGLRVDGADVTRG